MTRFVPPYRVVSRRKVGKALVATRPIARRETVARWDGARIQRRPTWQSVQISERRHADDPRSLNLLNHSCAPNVFLDIPRRRVAALRRIRAGEVLAFFYPSTEWAMARPFPCRCGARGGLAVVRGARDLPAAELGRAPVSAHIKRMKRAQAKRLKAARARRRADPGPAADASNEAPAPRLALHPAAGAVIVCRRSG
jgi:hypothetical protein